MTELGLPYPLVRVRNSGGHRYGFMFVFREKKENEEGREGVMRLRFEKQWRIYLRDKFRLQVDGYD